MDIKDICTKLKHLRGNVRIPKCKRNYLYNGLMKHFEEIYVKEM